MQEVIRGFQRLLPDFIEDVADQIVTTQVPVYAVLPRTQVQMALYNAIHSLGVDLAQGTTTIYANYWREVALQRAQQGISPAHSMLVTNLSTSVMTSQLKAYLGEQPAALAWWLERMHGIISLGMLVMTEARIDAMRQIGYLPRSGELAVAQSPAQLSAPELYLPPQTASSRSPSWLPAGEVLHLQTLGQSRVWRGSVEITSWGRKSAVQLLGLLITHRGHWLQREQIIELLWPDAPPRGAESQFKVALNTLMSTLEPERPPRMLSRYIERRGAAYQLTGSPLVQLDVSRFETLLDQAATAPDHRQAATLYRRALDLYQGDYLSDCVYNDWSRETRARLLNRYLTAACRLARLLLEGHQITEAIHWAEVVLARDNCWEEAYQLLLQAYSQEGNRASVLRTYERCVAALDHELGFAPLPETSALYHASLHYH